MSGLRYRQTESLTDPREWGHSGKFIKRNRVTTPTLGDRKAGRQPRTLLDAHAHRETDSQNDLVVESTALGWSKSLPPVFFVLTSSGRFGIGTSKNLASCSTTADLYNTNLFDLAK